MNEWRIFNSRLRLLHSLCPIGCTTQVSPDIDPERIHVEYQIRNPRGPGIFHVTLRLRIEDLAREGGVIAIKAEVRRMINEATA